MSARFTSSLLALVSLCAFTRAAAQAASAEAAVVEPIDVSVHSRRAIAATHRLDPTASGSSLPLNDRASTPRSLGDVIRESPGALVLSTGSMGAFQSVSFRGASQDETLVLLNEIPLSTADGGAFDLSMFPAELFSELNTYRGGAPVWLGSGAIGGVLQLVPHTGSRNRYGGQVGGGSFGTYQLNSGTDTALDNGITTHTQLVMRGTQGNYPYVDDGGTRFTSADDRVRRLQNGDYLEVNGIQDLTVPLRRGTLHALVLGSDRGGGLSGPASKPTPNIRRDSTRALTALSYSIEGGSTGRSQRKLQIIESGSFTDDHFADPLGELGISSHSDRNNRGFRSFTRAAGSLQLARWLEATSLTSYAYDDYLPSDTLSSAKLSRSTRHTVASALEFAACGSIASTRFELRPSARFEWTDTTINDARPVPRAGAASTRRLVVPTLRIGGVFEPIRGVALSASAATGTRVPSILELFGDGGLIRPSIGLQPVKSTSADVGLTVKRRLGFLRLSLEQRAFWQQRRNAIVASRTNQNDLVYQNYPTVHALGSESRLMLELWQSLRIHGSYTYTNSENQLGKRLPLRPRNVAYVRPEARLAFDSRVFSSVSLSSEYWHRSFAYLDASEVAYTSACTKLAFSAALNLFGERVRISGRVDDSLDARCQDLIGYPLPGRSLFFSVTYQEVEHDDS